MPGDVSFTYRGYRKQALYVLWRLLTDTNAGTQSYRPEGEEDLAVFDTSGQLVEAVQVKDHAAPLAVSDLKPASPGGFFARMKRRRQAHPSCRHVLATFGRLGVELGGAIAGTGPHRKTAAAKIHQGNSAIAESEAEEFLAELNGNVTRPEEARLRAGVLASLEGTIAGLHADTALEVLLYWIFEASEQRRTLTRSSVLQQLQGIGDYLSVLRDHTAEWMNALRPLSAVALADNERERLRHEYKLGVQAQWNHILAAADSVRPQRLAELHEKMTQHAVVVVRGASGQGKSSLALRYLHDYCAEGLRFHVRFVEGRTHASQIANALRGHVERLRLRAIVLLDLAPTDTGWVELVRQLTEIGLKVLVAVREEDFRRAPAIAPDVDIEDLVLDAISRDEAENIYQALIGSTSGEHALDFEEAWARFTSIDAGPLLEFTHLVSEGQTLNAKIEGQVSRLQAEASADEPGARITKAHLRLLALAAVANAAECHLKLSDACELVGLGPFERPLAVLENEYLVRLSDAASGTTIAGLHALRSQATERALLHDCPEMWVDLAIHCLPLVVDDDIERFLLSAFSRHFEYGDAVLTGLMALPLRTWSQAGGIGRALLWEGVSRYERENAEALSAVIAEHQGGWVLQADAFVGFDTTAWRELRRNLPMLSDLDIPEVPLTPKERVFAPLSAWAASVNSPAAPPVTELDWVLAGDLAFWIGTRSIVGPLRDALLQLLPEPLPGSLTLSDLGRFISGRAALADPAFADWHARHAAEIAQRFVRETRSIHVADEHDEVKVFFPLIVIDAASGDSPEAHDWQSQTMKRINLLRRLFPQRATFGSQAIGTELFADIMMHDPTTKAFPAADLPPDRAVWLNSVFIALVDYRHRRAPSWRAYAEAILRFRRAACGFFRSLHRGWGRFLEESIVQRKTIRQLPRTELERVNSLAHLPMFPQIAVDEWGFTSENRQHESPRSSRQAAGPALQAQDSDRASNVISAYGMARSVRRFRDWLKLWGEYEMGIQQVIRRMPEATAEHLAVKNPASNPPAETNGGRLLLVNLGNAWRVLAAMQSEFHRWFGRYVSPRPLDEIDSHESKTFLHLWVVASAFVQAPAERVIGGASSLEPRIEAQRQELLRLLREELEKVVAPEGGAARVSEGHHVIDGRVCLVVVCNHLHLATMEALRSEIVLAVWRAAQKSNLTELAWTPLTIEWPHVFMTHTLRGKALQSAGSFLSSPVLFVTLSDFRVAAHHVAALPVPVADFEALAIEIWDSPLLAAALGLQGGLAAFVLTMTRFGPLVDLASRYGLSDEALEPCLASFAKEISALRRVAADQSADLSNLLEALRRIGSARDWLVRLERCCNSILLANGGENVVLTPAAFEDWLGRVHEDLDETRAVLDEIVEFAAGGVAAEESRQVGGPGLR